MQIFVLNRENDYIDGETIRQVQQYAGIPPDQQRIVVNAQL
jgi:hypothetical protein